MEFSAAKGFSKDELEKETANEPDLRPSDQNNNTSDHNLETLMDGLQKMQMNEQNTPSMSSDALPEKISTMAATQNLKSLDDKVLQTLDKSLVILQKLERRSDAVTAGTHMQELNDRERRLEQAVAENARWSFDLQQKEDDLAQQQAMMEFEIQVTKEEMQKECAILKAEMKAVRQEIASARRDLAEDAIKHNTAMPASVSSSQADRDNPTQLNLSAEATELRRTWAGMTPIQKAVDLCVRLRRLTLQAQSDRLHEDSADESLAKAELQSKIEKSFETGGNGFIIPELVEYAMGF